MRIMVTGSRTWGECSAGVKHSNLLRCPQYAAAWRQMFRAIAEEVRVLTGGSLDDAPPIELIHGDQVGADRMAAQIWSDYGLGPVTAFPYVKELGGYGGHARNDVLVAHMPDLVLAFHLNHSPGTADAIARARKAGLDVHVYPKENQA